MIDKLAEHIQDTAPCSSRWDGFDRGDRYDTPEIVERCIGRMTSEAGYRVTIMEFEFEGDYLYEVFINGDRVYQDFSDRATAIRVARWWMDGCPA